jgi:PAS domain S-box-containing protein
MSEGAAGVTAVARLNHSAQSLIARLPVRWIVLSLVSAAIIGTTVRSYREIDRELTAAALSRREVVVQLTAATLTEKFGRLVDVAIALATRPRVQDLVAQGKWVEASEFLRSVPRDLPHIERLFLAEVRGTLKADVPRLPAVRGTNFAFRDWFQGVSRDWHPYISPVYTRAATPRLNVFAVAVPVKNARGGVTGILVLQIRIESLFEWVEALGISPEEFIYIVDSKGQVAFHSKYRDRREIVDLSETPVVQRLRRGEHGVETGFDPVEREDSIIAYAAVPEYGWGVVAQQPTRASLGLAARDEQLRRLLTGYGLILLLGSTAVFLMARIAVARKRAENDARFVTIVNAAADAIISLDQAQRIVLFNRGAEIIFGYSAAELVGQPLDLLIPARLADAHRQHIREFALEENAMRTMGKNRVVMGLRKDGSEFPVEANVSKLWQNGRWVFTVFLRDVTERVRAERVLQEKDKMLTLVGTMAKVGGWEFDTRTLKGTWTDEVARIHDMDPKAETGAEIGLAFYQGESRERIDAAVKEAIEHGTPYDLELEMITAKGNHKWVRTIGQPIEQDGKVVKVMGSFQDITEHKLAAEEIRCLNADLERKVLERTVELQAVNKELEAFSYSVSHDLRAPLRSIDGFSQAVLEDYAHKLDAQGRKYLQRVRAASQRMAELIDDMLTLSRVTRAAMQCAPVDLSALAAAAMEELRQAQPERTVDVVIRPGLVAEGDARLLRVLLMNLLANAWKFTGKRDQARIEFGATRDNGRPVFFVRDNGVGFDMKYANKLFGAFQRLHGMDEFPGTGVGLATVQRIAHRHGGQAWAEAAVGQGATFYFALRDTIDP